MESVKIKENFRQVQLKAEEIHLFNESFVIVPYQVSGFIDFSNRGNVSHVSEPNNYETFKRVWTGNDACVINWKNSLKITQDPITKKGIYNYKLGEVFLGLMETNSFSNEISKDISFSEYTSQQQVNTLTFRVDKMFKITDYYNFMFYKIPEISGSTLYRIENIEKDFVGRTLIGYVITFKTINQELANTGRAKQQNIMPCAPGQGYLECIVYQSKEEFIDRVGEDKFNSLVPDKDYYELFGRYITGDWEKIKHRPVRKMEIKFFGPAAINTIMLIGRPVNGQQTFSQFLPQRAVFLNNFETAKNPTLYRTQQTSSNFALTKFDFNLTNWIDFKNKIESIFSSKGDNSKWNYEGWIDIERDLFNNSNKLTSKNKYEYDIFGQAVIEGNDRSKRKWEVDFNRNIDCLGNTATEKVYTLGNTPNGNNVKNIETIFFDNYWVMKQQKIMPVSNRNTLTLGIVPSLIIKWYEIFNPVFGGLFKIGIEDNFINRSRVVKTVDFFGIIDKAWAEQQLDITNKDSFISAAFSSEENSPSSIFYANDTIQSGFRASLTEHFSTERTNKILSTIDIGQTHLQANGEPIFPSGDKFLLNGDSILLDTFENAPNWDYGYIIDGIKICSIGKTDIEINFLDSQDEVIWSGVYQSQAKWTNSLKEIWTEINTSIFGRENTYLTEPFPGLKPLLPVRPSYEDKEILIMARNYLGKKTGWKEKCIFLYDDNNSKNSEFISLFENKQVKYLMRNIDKENFYQTYKNIEFEFYIQIHGREFIEKHIKVFINIEDLKNNKDKWKGFAYGRIQYQEQGKLNIFGTGDFTADIFAEIDTEVHVEINSNNDLFFYLKNWNDKTYNLGARLNNKLCAPLELPIWDGIEFNATVQLTWIRLNKK